jgi:chorismate mutase
VTTRGVRGATTVESNTVEAILEATKDLLAAMLKANDIETEDVASAFFTTTPDLNAEFPAVAARDLGWSHVALLCGHEMNKPGALPMCLRILLHVNTETPARDIRHIYLRGARVLRPDIDQTVGGPSGNRPS